MKNTQIKSIYNPGLFSPTDPHIMHSLGDDYISDGETARWTPERINLLYDTYAASSPDYSQAYAAFITPDEFLSLTTTNPQRIESESAPLDREQLAAERQVIHLTYDPALPGEVWGHEGRHRMAALKNAGVKRVAIAVEFLLEAGKYNRQPIESLELIGEEFATGRAPGKVTLRNLVPISQSYRPEIEALYGAQEGDVRYSLDEYTDETGQIGEIVAFYPEQIKSVDNKNPTANPDIRFSLADSQEYAEFMRQFNEKYGLGAAEAAIQNLQQMQRAKARAERRAAELERKLDLKHWSDKIEKIAAVEQAKKRGQSALGKQRQVFLHAKEVQRRKDDMRAALELEKARLEKIRAVEAQKTRDQARMKELENRLKEDARMRLNRSKRAEDYRTAEADLAARMHEGRKVAEQRSRVEAERKKGQQRVSETRALARRSAKEAKLALRRHRNTHPATKDNAEFNTLRALPGQPNKTLREKIRAGAAALRVQGRSIYKWFVSQALALERFGQLQTDNLRADTLINIVGGSRNTIEAIFKKGLVNRSGDTVGASLEDTVVMWQGYGGKRKVDWERQQILQDYMLHLHNIDRMSFVAKARAAVEEFEKKWPAFRDISPKQLALLVAQGDPIAQRYVELLRRAQEAKDKSVFADVNGKPITADTSRAVVEEYRKEHPWVVGKAKEIHDWWDAFMREWAVGTSISLEQYEMMRSIYPNYVPTYRVEKGGPGVAAFVGRGSASIGQAVKRAIGGTSEIVPIEDQYADLVSKIVRLNRNNELFRNIIDTAMLDEDGAFEEFAIFDWESAENSLELFQLQSEISRDDVEKRTKAALEKLDDGAYRVNAWINGERISAFISEEMYDALMSITGTKTGSIGEKIYNGAINVGNFLTSPLKTMITGINPFFASRNISRDFPTAVINSISGLAFPKYYAMAAVEIAKNSDHWKRFQALGGTNGNFYNNERGFAEAMSRGKNIFSRGVDKLGRFNTLAEAQTRFAEYLATIHRLPGGDTYENRLQGIKNAAEVTVDFSRKGTVGKLLNAWIPYWNPAVQGIDKVIRSVIGEEKNAKAIAKNAALRTGRAMLTTVVMEALLQAILSALDRRDDWEKLSDRTKDAYYCIPIGNSHTFLKIPKNREWGAILGTTFSRIIQGMSGRSDPFENYLETSFVPNFLPPSPFDAIGVDQYIALSTNQDFAGRAIIPYAYQNASPEEQYNSETSMLAMGIARGLDKAGVSDLVQMISEDITLSPMQVDYIIHDYCGDFVSMILELFPQGLADGSVTPDEITNAMVEAVTKPFVADNRYSNEIVSKYYDILDELDRAVVDMRVRGTPEEEIQESTVYKLRSALNADLGKRITELNAEVRNAPAGKEKDDLKQEIALTAAAAVDFYNRTMAGEIEEPKLYQEFAGYSDSLRKELIRLRDYTEDYGIKPSSYKPTTISVNDRKEYVLTEEQRDQYGLFYNENYERIMSATISKPGYKKASDEKKAEKLEAAREEVLEAAKEDLLDWLKEQGIKPTKKKK